jgi:hypothetical protein
MSVLGCITHWYESMLFGVPFFGLVGYFSYTTRRDKRREARGEGPVRQAAVVGLDDSDLPNV